MQRFTFKYQTILKAKLENYGHCSLKDIQDAKWKNLSHLSDDMRARELAAQIEIDKKKLQIAPAYNKGAYQPITNKQNVVGIHKK